MTITEIEYGGRDELSMSQYEALATIDDSVDYNITDYPDNSITNSQMDYALTCVRLFNAGETFICSDSGTYKIGHTYKIVVSDTGTKSWEDITPSGGGSSVEIDNISITKTTDNKLQAVGLQDETDSKILTAHDIWLACSIEREV